MKKILIGVLLGATILASAQEKPKEPTVAELKLQVATLSVQVATLKLQLIQAQAQKDAQAHAMAVTLPGAQAAKALSQTSLSPGNALSALVGGRS